MSRVRVAVVGVGHLGRIHAQKLAARDDVELVAVTDSDEATRTRVAESCATRAVTDHSALIDEVDAAFVAAPTRYHETIGLDLLGAGIPVFMEKPLAPTAAEAKRLVSAARRAKVTLQVGHVERFNPAWHAALPYLNEPKYIEATRHGGFTFRSTDVGVVLDLMVHDLDLILSIVRSPVRSIQALGVSVFGRHEDAANARVEFKNGCVATLNASRASYAASRTMQVWTPRQFTSIDFGARAATVVEPDATIRGRQFDADSTSAERRAYLLEHLFEEHLPVRTLDVEPADAIEAEQDDFFRAIRDGSPPLVSGRQGAEAVETANRIQMVIDAHRWDGTADGRVGPLALPQTGVLRGPHWHRKSGRASAETEQDRRAG